MLGTDDQKPGSSSAAELAADMEDGEQEQIQGEDEELGGPEDVDAEALELMGQGKRNLVVGDPPAAVQCFQEACELLAGKYGETAEECADAYYQYGCALLELGSVENGVLGNALQGVPDESAESADSDEEEVGKIDEKVKEEVSKQVKDALEANLESEESEKEDKEKEDGKKEETEEEKMEEDAENKEVEKADKDEKQEIKEKEKEEKEKEEMKDDEKKDEKKIEAEVNEEKKDTEKVVEKDETKDVKDNQKMEDDADAKEESKDEKMEEKDDNESEKEEKEKEDKDDADKKIKSGKKEEEDEAGTSAEDQKVDADDVSNFQLAWEMLELARVILSKKEDEESKLKISQIHLKLGELGLETEQYAQSVEDFKTCLEIQEKYLDAESRLIAGTHYNLGLALSFDNKFEQSVKHYRESKQLIEKRLESLEKIISETEGKGKEKADENDPIVSAQKEMDELKELLPDIVSKLEDAKEMKTQARTTDGAGPSSSSGFASSSSGFASSGFAQSSSTAPVQQIAVRKADSVPVTDISNLVRKKRKPEDSEETTAEPKRSRQEEDKPTDGDKPAVNGSGDSAVVNGNGHMANGNGVMNGDSEASSEKPSEIKVKKLPPVEEEKSDAMETA